VGSQATPLFLCRHCVSRAAFSELRFFISFPQYSWKLGKYPRVLTRMSLQTALWFLAMIDRILGTKTTLDLHKIQFRSDIMRTDRKHFSKIIKKIFLGNGIKLFKTIDIKQLIFFKCVNIRKYLCIIMYYYYYYYYYYHPFYAGYLYLNSRDKLCP
jgi:hypothetical protein